MARAHVGSEVHDPHTAAPGHHGELPMKRERGRPGKNGPQHVDLKLDRRDRSVLNDTGSTDSGASTAQSSNPLARWS
jgi:hypothetical protein